MGVNQVKFGGRTLIDLTSDTVTAADMISGVTAHDKSGNLIVGSYVPPPPASGVINISSNGYFDVASYANANVNVPSGYPRHTSGVFTGSGQTSVQLNTGGFRPKQVLCSPDDVIYNSSKSTYYYVAFFALFDDNGAANTIRRLFISMEGSRARLGRSWSGVSSSGENITLGGEGGFIFASGIAYNYHIWGD